MRELERLSDVERCAAGDGQPVWAAQGRGGDRLGPGVRAWRHGAALAVASPSAQQDRLAVRGDAADAAVLVRRVLDEAGPSYRLLGEAPLIDALVRRLPGLVPVHRFLWMETTTRSGVATADVRWLDADEVEAAAPLFDRYFPDSYARPGRAGVRRWAGAPGDAGTEPLAVAADAWSAAGCGFMGGVVTHPAARGRGLARAVCGFVLDALVQRHGRAALMVMADNAPAIATYERLGLTKRLFGAAHRPER
ncbi:GNAT family N-acetyltransferase [Streptomyces sp. 3MP-14]|uniref:GNAT family N-acetyltransferase n=1 Tax=Streptomyces mimosae TaxID=2586635 RepID=A0A5N6A147_9ACTN|nr:MULTISPECIES: GNAT family N-acetyltransferase [Streptomyces]KAB8161709.1 GNAT family N-acetyltransferase [Streptomyces mimosae]KAB8175023.1 GNAT family N-acetyltransferase [Streptomyces sp. 3MP-14]